MSPIGIAILLAVALAANIYVDLRRQHAFSQDRDPLA
jgi:hypothetical protein